MNQNFSVKKKLELRYSKPRKSQSRLLFTQFLRWWASVEEKKNGYSFGTLVLEGLEVSVTLESVVTGYGSKVPSPLSRSPPLYRTVVGVSINQGFRNNYQD